MRVIAALIILLLARCTAPTDAAPTGAPEDGPIAPRACPEPRSTVGFEHPGIQEASGLARSQREACVFWVHDDSGADPVIYAVDGSGRSLGEAWLEVRAIDREDTASFTLGAATELQKQQMLNRELLKTIAKGVAWVGAGTLLAKLFFGDE